MRSGEVELARGTSIQTQVNEALNRPMNRLGFLKLVGGVLVALVGIPTLIVALGGKLGSDQPGSHVEQSGGYGSAPYGR